ncbi:hypothetical protein C7974DRAFT_413806 [Boeremia exigua]|uniref:uncharacterized protein n=1 Tax=Boeremia exigua TaxID=749465 RepID=UPI001E8CC4A4|nr:uncharacterized protein C7974DRAFT_413806 [Boeremia exigua]KAH6625275.1 hypothetical protein C7974DRAFT_413806 [Boeremia exigua]
MSQYNNNGRPPFSNRPNRGGYNANFGQRGGAWGRGAGGRGAWASGGDAGSFTGGRGAGGRGAWTPSGDAGSFPGRRRAGVSGAPTGSRSDMQNAAIEGSAQGGLKFDQACYMPPPHGYQDQSEVAARKMGMDEAAANCLRCGRSKEDGHLNCPKLYCTRSWYKKHGFDLRCPDQLVSNGQMRFRPSEVEITGLLRLGCDWVRDIMPASEFNTGTKQSANDAFGEESNLHEEIKRLNTINNNAVSRMKVEIGLRRAAEAQVRTLQASIDLLRCQNEELRAKKDETPAPTADFADRMAELMEDVARVERMEEFAEDAATVERMEELLGEDFWVDK